ncbi:MAG: class I SAM-dependent methyltransferase [Acidobacteria bacterium]|nr:class I SAM-dependent methyltransferase [Acidobacteriota bacterium]
MSLAVWREDRYKTVLQHYEKSKTLGSIWQEVFRDDYPARARPFGFTGIQELEVISQELNLDSGKSLLDLGCGTGGPGLYISEKICAALTGVDVVAEALEVAAKNALQFRLAIKPVFLHGSATEVPLPDRSMQSAMSIDCFWMILDKCKALKELSRVLVPDARFVFTTWLPPYIGIDALLATGGLSLVRHTTVPHWKERQLEIYRLILEHKDRLADEMGPEATAALVDEANHAPFQLSTSPRCLVVAQKSK